MVMKEIKNYNLTEIENNEALNTFGGMNPAEWIMYKAGQLKYKLSSWLNSSQLPSLSDNVDDYHFFS